MEQNAIWAGYSLARLGMLSVILVSWLAGLLFLFWVSFKPARLVSLVHYGYANNRVNRWIPVLFSVFCLTGVLFLIVIVNGILNSGANLGFGRSVLFFVWLEITTGYVLGLIGSQFFSILSSLSSWRKSIESIKADINRLPLSFWILSIASALAIGVLVVYSPAFAGRMPRHDSGIFLYFGSRILKGDIPFRDLWDHKPPLIFYIDALGLILADHSIWGVWFLEVVSLLLAMCFIQKTLKIWLPALGLLLALLGFIAAFLFSMEGGNLTEEFGLPLQCASIWLFCNFVVKEKQVIKAWFGIGLLLGLALMLKQTLIGVWVAIFLVVLYRILIGQLKVSAKHGLAFVAGLFLVVVLSVVYFYANHSLFAFWDVAFRYNFIYSDITWADRLRAVWAIFWIVFFQRSFVLFIGLAAWIFFLAHAYGNFKKAPAILQFAIINYPLELALISLSGEDFDHYFFTIIPAVVILIGFAWASVQKKIDHTIWVRNLVFAGLLVGLFWMPGQQLASAFLMKDDAAMLKVINYVQENSERKDKVLFWGDMTALNFIADREAPTRFADLKPLFRKGYASDALSAEILNDLVSKKPLLIIDTHLVSTPFIHFDPSGACILPEPPLPDGMADVYHFICAHYYVADDLGGKDKWLVYKLR